MKRGIIYFGTVFISIILLSILIRNSTNESFVIEHTDHVLEAIEIVKQGFRNIEEAMKKKENNEPVCPPPPIDKNAKMPKGILDTKVIIPAKKLPISNIVSVNLQHLDSVASTYMAMDEYEQDPISSLNTIQKELNEYISIYTYINDKLKLALPPMTKNMLNINAVNASCKQFSEKLPLKRPQLYSQLLKQVTNKVPTPIIASMPATSSFEPPPQLIKSALKPYKKSSLHTQPIIDIFSKLNNVYRYPNNINPTNPPLRVHVETPPIQDIYTQLDKAYSTSRINNVF